LIAARLGSADEVFITSTTRNLLGLQLKRKGGRSERARRPLTGILGS